MSPRQKMAQKVQGRFRDGKLDLREHQGMLKVQFNNREEWRVQSYDVSKVWIRVLLDLYGAVE